MKRIVAAVCIAALILGLAAAQAENGAFGMRVYGAGTYQVGAKIDAGEYILFSATEEPASFSIRVGEEVISEDSFSMNVIVAVENGDTLALSDCTAVYAPDYYSTYYLEVDEFGGMLKVGADLQPGAYVLIAREGGEPLYRIYQDIRHRTVIEEKVFNDSCEVSLKENQYLELIDCGVGALIADLGTTYAPQSTPAPDAPAEPQTTASRKESTVLSTATPKPTPVPTPEPTPEPTPVPTRKPTATPKPEEELPAEPAKIVRIDRTRTPVVRTEPSTKGKKLGVTKSGAEYELVEIQEKWYKIRLENGEEGWISSSMAEVVE